MERAVSGLGHNRIRLIWRVATGMLAVLAFALAVLRIYVLMVQGPPPDSGDLGLAFSVLFPLSVALLFGYFAFVGKIPGKENKDS
ncbi:MAG: hypothetical protein OES46_14215 [Gammaproteobacteria bacterium]|nr:hypothetical protein [Gammaproteobacteria bacterium]